MPGFFYQLGRLAAPKVRKAKWVWQSLTGTEAEALQAEFEVGRDLNRAIAAEVEVDRDAQLTALIEQIGQRLAACVTNKQREFAFQVFASPQANAFALPGGFIWITRQLIDLCQQSGDELAFILGHEMGHILRKHAIERMVAQSLIRVGVGVMPAGGIVRGQLGRVVMNLLDQRYSQDQELDADSLGVRLASYSGFDPSGAIRLLDRLRQTDDSSQLESYFSSHPPFDVRIQRIQRTLRS